MSTEGEAGAPVADLVRLLGVSEQTHYQWKRLYAGLESNQARELKQLPDENARFELRCQTTFLGGSEKCRLTFFSTTGLAAVNAYDAVQASAKAAAAAEKKGVEKKVSDCIFEKCSLTPFLRRRSGGGNGGYGSGAGDIAELGAARNTSCWRGS